uniref:TX-II propeptide n=1 Tax=Carukia barnesi TaxID=168717 RepID=A0A0R8I8W6_CARBN|nr:TX-II propeptide [Carukia barnesi]
MRRKIHRCHEKKNCEKTCGHCNDCYDKYPSRCSYFKKLGLCDKMPTKMEKYCYKTCGHCRMPAPPPCANTALGCCWNRVTTKIDKAGSNCPVCKDSYKRLCKTFSDDCSHKRSAGKFMRHYCPETCGLCNGGGCADQPDQAKYCSFWKGQGLCENDKNTMKLFCKKTCNLC